MQARAGWVVAAFCAGLSALIAFPVARADRDDDRDGHNLGCIEGTWAVQAADGRIFRETLVLGRDGQTIHFALNSRLPPGDPTLGGIFPDASFDMTGPARGSGVRIGPDTFEFRIISWAVNVIDGVRSEVAYIQINEGIVVFPDCDTQEVVSSVSWFLPEQDADGDGLPDEGEEPFAMVSDLAAGATKFFP